MNYGRAGILSGAAQFTRNPDVTLEKVQLFTAQLNTCGHAIQYRSKVQAARNPPQFSAAYRFVN
jgi:hypothetical protein